MMKHEVLKISKKKLWGIRLKSKASYIWIMRQKITKLKKSQELIKMLDETPQLLSFSLITQNSISNGYEGFYRSQNVILKAPPLVASCKENRDPKVSRK